jgi:HNH endonuclease
MKGRRHIYSNDELCWIAFHAVGPRKMAHANFVKKFNRPDVNLGAYAGLCKRKGWLTGNTGRFAKGQNAWNQGLPMPFNANSAATQFKKGGLPLNTKKLGHERVSVDGYVEISIAEKNPHTGFERRFVLKHRHIWEKHHGPVPAGMVLKCVDGDKTNCDVANWQAVPRGLLPRLNNRWGREYDHAPREVKPTLMAIAKLEHKMSSVKGKK